MPTGAAPHVLASFRNAMLSWFDGKYQTRVASALRALAWHGEAAIAFVTEPV